MTLAIALAILLPMMLGPAFGPLASALGVAETHLCACGMPRGTCGCPECEKLEHQRLREHAPRPYPVLRSQCGGDDQAAAFPALPPWIAPATGVGLIPSPREWSAVAPPADIFSRDLAEPLTPPPRVAI